MKLGYLETPYKDPMFFYQRAANAAYRDFEANGAEHVVDPLCFGHCARRDVTLIIVLIPDKYQFHLDSLSHLTGDLDGYGRRTLPRRRAPGMVAERIQQQGIHVIDFFPLL